MSNFKDTYKLKARILIELLISIFIISIILLASVQLLVAGVKLANNNKQSKINLIEYDYSINYILDEIDQAEYILDKSRYKIRNNKWLDLVFVKTNKDKGQDKYNIITYIQNDKNEIIRKSRSLPTMDINVLNSSFDGNNALLSDVESFKGYFDDENMLLEIEIKFLDSDRVYKIYHSIKGEIYG